MDVQVETTGPCSRTVTIKIPPSRVVDHVERAFTQASRQVQIKGFRPGKVPRAVIEKKFGPGIRAEAHNQLLNESFRDACRDHDIKIVGQPRIEGLDEQTMARAEQGIEFKVHCDVKPTIQLGEVEGIEVDERPTAVTPEDIQRALEQLADQKRTLETVEEPAGETDFLRCDLSYRNAEGEEVHRRENSQVNPGIPIAGTDPAAFKSAVVGKAKGDEFETAIQFSPHFEVEAVRGQSGRVVGKVLDVQRVQRSAIDDALAKEFGFDDLEKMKAELDRQIGERKVAAEKLRQEEAILTTIVERTPFDLPLNLVEQQFESDLAAYRKRLEGQQRTSEEIDGLVEQNRAEARNVAERRIRMIFLLEAISMAKKIGVEESDMYREIEGIAAQNQVSTEQVVAHMRQNDLFGELSMGILERKIREFLRDKAKITDKSQNA
ncbi:MAG: trigger factor [Planctomycetota bacterium]